MPGLSPARRNSKTFPLASEGARSALGSCCCWRCSPAGLKQKCCTPGCGAKGGRRSPALRSEGVSAPDAKSSRATDAIWLSRPTGGGWLICLRCRRGVLNARVDAAGSVAIPSVNSSRLAGRRAESATRRSTLRMRFITRPGVTARPELTSLSGEHAKTRSPDRSGDRAAAGRRSREEL